MIDGQTERTLAKLGARTSPIPLPHAQQTSVNAFMTFFHNGCNESYSHVFEVQCAMELSPQDFCQSAHELVEILNGLRDQEGTEWSLSSWVLNEDEKSPSSVYLSHPPIVTSQLDEGDLPESRHDFPLEDFTVLQDPQTSIDCQDENRAISIQWDFSIVYSDTYRVPVLYFRVQKLDGTPVTRTQVLNLLPKQQIKDSWDFISQDEHPITCFPSFFLHPCQTATRLEQLNLSNGNQRSMVLWAWMSMVFPAVDQGIPPSYFNLVLNSVDNAT
eukprot:scaffold16150_cov112-Cylindrotheca_fusiformis.AAC.3